MKLYATVKSERASKGQGGNKYIDINLLVGSAHESEHFANVRLNIVNGFYTLWIDGTVLKIQSTEKEEKGNKQKGESKSGCLHEKWTDGICNKCGYDLR